MEAFTKERQNDTSPQMAIDFLKKGNERFVQNKMTNRKLTSQVNDTRAGQNPYAVVLGCIDSRVPSELVFDQGIGDIFNVRIAGNFCNTDILGSMEFGCKVAGSKAIVVLGHSHCGAVKGACDKVDLGNLTSMLNKITPAVDAVEESGARDSSNAAFVNKVVHKNIEMTVENIRANSPILKEMEDKGEIKIVGAHYDVETGKVDFL